MFERVKPSFGSISSILFRSGKFSWSFSFIRRNDASLLLILTIYTNNKVLLRERKRHTACRVASARSAALSPDEGGGTPRVVQSAFKKDMCFFDTRGFFFPVIF